jgi:molybdopterin-guanine dinucleotide biosynthesis protein B
MEDLLKDRNNTNKPFVLSFVSTCSGAGKTTLIEKIIYSLKGRGYRVGALKHDAHQFEIDKKGKDSYRFTHAGAEQVIIASAEQLGLVRILKEELEIETILKMFVDVDIILIEGFRQNKFPKIEVHRKEADSQLLCNRPDYNLEAVIAVASDEEVIVPMPVLNLNDTEKITDFIEARAGLLGKGCENR